MPIRNVSNENIRSPENQKVLIFWYPLKKKVCGWDLSSPRGLWGRENLIKDVF
jgi:hypothetical protein